MSRPNHVLAAAAAVLLLAAGRAGAEPYRNPEHRFAVELPAGWEPFSTRELKMVNARATQDFPGMDVVFAAAFRPVRGDMSVFVLVQVDTDVPAGQSFEEFEREFLRDFDLAREGNRAAAIKVTRRLADERPTFDREKKRYTVRDRADRRNRGVWVHSTGYFGPGLVVILHAFAESAEYRAQQPTFAKIADSFKFEEPEEPAAPPHFLDKMLGTSLDPTQRMGIVGGAVGLAVLVLGALVTRDRSDRNAPRF